MTADEVVREITQRAWRFGVAVLLQPTPKVFSGNVYSGGYFDGDNRVLAVGIGRDEDSWLGILLHEYCHLTQWVENQPVWRQYREEMWDWLAGKRIRNPEQAVRSVQATEEDCERRTIRLAVEMQAPIDLEKYIRGANAYIHFHNVILETRKWYREDASLIDDPAVLEAANPTLDTDFRKTPPALRKALLQAV